VSVGQPPDEEAGRRVIVHLKGMAKRPESSHLKGLLTPPTRECPAPLWDRELDG
jgi:hypothetical protein